MSSGPLKKVWGRTATPPSGLAVVPPPPPALSLLEAPVFDYAPLPPPPEEAHPKDQSIGQIGQSVGMFLLTAHYTDPTQLADVIHRLMLGEKIRVTACGMSVYVWRDREFANWWLRR